ncbi:g11157 [Coccomyxa elongata]
MFAASVFVGLTVLSHASGRTLQDVPAPDPTAAAGDAIVAIVDPKGVTTAVFPVVDGSDLKVSPTNVTVVKPDGQTQAVLSLTTGNSTMLIQPTATSKGFITILQPTGPSARVPLVPRTAAAPTPAGLPAEITSMPRFYDWDGWRGGDGGGGSFAITFALAVAPGAVSVGLSVVDVFHGSFESGTVSSDAV